MDSADTLVAFGSEANEGERIAARQLWELFGVDEDNGAYVIIIGLVLAGIAVIGCCYCKVYDPSRDWCNKKYEKCCTRKPRRPPPPAPDEPSPEERKHWYLNKTLEIDNKDRDELGPIGQTEGLKGGWYGARNGGFNV